jgi:putative FmdB family regulatory protein
MPTYDYVCEGCGNKFEQFQTITAKPLRVCPKCGQQKLNRLIGSGSGIIFKGSGFYQTDYRSDSYNKAAAGEKKSAQGSQSKKTPETKEKSTSETPKPAAAKDSTKTQ